MENNNVSPEFIQKEKLLTKLEVDYNTLDNGIADHYIELSKLEKEIIDGIGNKSFFDTPGLVPSNEIEVEGSICPSYENLEAVYLSFEVYKKLKLKLEFVIQNYQELIVMLKEREGMKAAAKIIKETMFN